MFRIRFTCVALMLACFAPAALATPIYSGSGSDPAGDLRTPLGADTGLHDLASVLVEVDATTFFARVLFQEGTYRGYGESNTSVVGIGLDLDQDPGTGFPGMDTLNNDSEFVGTDILIDLEGIADVLTINRFDTDGSLASRDFLDSSDKTELDDGIEVSLPLSLLNDDEGLLGFYVTTQQYRGGPSTGIIDYASDVGVPVLQTSRAGAPAPVPVAGVLWLMLLGLPLIALLGRPRAARRVEGPHPAAHSLT